MARSGRQPRKQLPRKDSHFRHFGGTHLGAKKIPWQRRRQLGMAVAGNTPTASFLTKIGKMQSARCRLCRIAREARGESSEVKIVFTIARKEII